MVGAHPKFVHEFRSSLVRGQDHTITLRRWDAGSERLLVLGSGVATERGVTPLFGKCNFIFTYIYTNITKLVLHLSYLLRLD